MIKPQESTLSSFNYIPLSSKGEENGKEERERNLWAIILDLITCKKNCTSLPEAVWVSVSEKKPLYIGKHLIDLPLSLMAAI